MFGCKNKSINKKKSQSDFSIDNLVVSICRVLSCIVGKVYFLWLVGSLEKTLLDFAMFYFVLQSQACLLLQVSLAFLICITIIYDEKDNFLVLVLEALVSLHRTVQLQLLWHQCLGHRLGLLWYLMVCIGNKMFPKMSFLRFHPSTAFWTLLLIWGLPGFP